MVADWAEDSSAQTVHLAGLEQDLAIVSKDTQWCHSELSNEGHE